MLYPLQYANVMPLCRYACYAVMGENMDTEISATRIYSNGAYLYVENRIIKIKSLLF